MQTKDWPALFRLHALLCLAVTVVGVSLVVWVGASAAKNPVPWRPDDISRGVQGLDDGAGPKAIAVDERPFYWSFSLWVGIVALVFGEFQLLPQIIYNFRYHTAGGLDIVFVLLEAVALTLSCIGSVLVEMNQVAIVQAAVLGVTCWFLLAQMLYYRYWYAGTSAQADSGVQVDLEQGEVGDAMMSSSYGACSVASAREGDGAAPTPRRRAASADN